MVGFGLEGESVAAEGNVLVLNPRNAVAGGESGAGGGVPRMEKQAPRWPDEHGATGCVFLSKARKLDL